MDLKIKLVLFVLSVFFLVVVFITLHKNILRPSFALLWLLMAFILMTIPLFDGFYRWVAYSLMGLEDARDVVYIYIIGFLMVYVLFLTIKISQLADYIHELISYTSIDRYQIEKKSPDENI